MKRIPIYAKVYHKEHGNGVVYAHHNNHDISVGYENGSSCLHCQDKECSDYEELTVIDAYHIEVCEKGIAYGKCPLCIGCTINSLTPKEK